MEFKATKDGIEINYNRFLSDTASSFFLYIILFLDDKFYSIFFSSISLGLKLADVSVLILSLALLLFIIATPLGMIISTMSWLVLENLYINFIELLYFKCVPISKMIQLNNLNDICTNYGITKKNWHLKTAAILEKLISDKKVVDDILIKRSMRILLRNLTFIFLIVFILKIIFLSEYTILYLVLSVILLFLSGAIGYLQNLMILLRHYIGENDLISKSEKTTDTN